MNRKSVCSTEGVSVEQKELLLSRRGFFRTEVSSGEKKQVRFTTEKLLRDLALGAGRVYIGLAGRDAAPQATLTALRAASVAASV